MFLVSQAGHGLGFGEKRSGGIGSHCVIMPGVTIGESAIIGACSFVNKDIPANTIAVGVPAKVIRKMEK